MNILYAIVLAAFFGFMGLAKAENQNQSSEKIKNQSLRESKAGVFQKLNTSFSTDMKKTTDSSKAYAGDFSYALGYKFESGFSLSFSTSIEKSLSGLYEESWQNSKISLSKDSVMLFSDIAFIPTTAIVLPTSEESKRGEELNFGLEVISLGDKGLENLAKLVDYGIDFLNAVVTKTVNHQVLLSSFIALSK